MWRSTGASAVERCSSRVGRHGDSAASNRSEDAAERTILGHLESIEDNSLNSMQDELCRRETVAVWLAEPAKGNTEREVGTIAWPVTLRQQLRSLVPLLKYEQGA
jgi:hypothetical protein